MGSIDKALLTGFICRLCSEMHRVVIHIYGVEGLRLGLHEKINKYLPVNVSIAYVKILTSLLLNFICQILKHVGFSGVTFRPFTQNHLSRLSGAIRRAAQTDVANRSCEEAAPSRDKARSQEEEKELSMCFLCRLLSFKKKLSHGSLLILKALVQVKTGL